MANELERRIRLLLSTWDPVSPFRVSLKLVLDDVKRLEKPETLRFSHEKSRCGLPLTNLNGRCRKFVEPKRIFAVDQQAEDDSVDVKETYDGLVNSEKALREQKIGHEGNVRRMRTKAGNGTVQMKLAME